MSNKMDRRKSLKIIATGTAATGALLVGCNTDKVEDVPVVPKPPEFKLDRAKEELEREHELLAQGTFFTPHEMATITLLADIIIPRDEISGSASDAGVPDFIEFIVKDMPQHQVPMRGGLRWVDMQCLKQYEKTFVDCDTMQQIEMVDKIAYPEKVEPALAQGAAFFSRMRNLTASGFYTSQIGVKDVGYMGNTPNRWDGVPDDVLKQHGFAYSQKELDECVKFDV
jgi:gluconate 2-dehydrogenase gamma chain